MNWKPGLLWCFLLTVGAAMAGCGAAADRATEGSTSAGSTSAADNPGAEQTAETTAAANFTLVTLDLPGMT